MASIRQFHRCLFTVIALLTFTASALVSVQAATAVAPGTVRGKIQNASNGAYMENVVVTISGTSHQAITNSFGEYEFRDVPAGEITLVAKYVGEADQKVAVTVLGGVAIEQDFAFRQTEKTMRNKDGTLILDPYVVSSERYHNAKAIALAEERNSITIKNVVAVDEFGIMPSNNVGEFVKFLSGSRRGTTVSYGRGPVRVGRSTSAELRFADAQDAVVSNHHAQILFEHGAYVLVDTGSTNGTLLNGRKITKHELKSGDKLRFGFPGGPEACVEIDAAALPPVPGGAMADTIVSAPRPSQPVYDAKQDAERMASVLKSGAEDTSAFRMADEVAHEVTERRAKMGGKSSGDTVIILARGMNRVNEAVRSRTKSRWVKVVTGVGGGALVVISLLAVVIFYQQRQIDRLVHAKTTIDSQIQSLQQRMQSETDSASLSEMEDSLAALTGSAQTTLEELQRKDEARAAQLTAGGDELDREIRKILVKFNASTYAIPPIFRERLQFHIDALNSAGNRKFMYGRKQRYWPAITKDFDALGLPEEMAYIAWVESGFDPNAQSGAGAVGLWQMTRTTAQSLGLTVNGAVDERLDPDKQTKAAASYLASLLSEFGEDSFMLVLASYNRGENGVRRVLHQVARDPGGFRKDKRDFWHLYRLKLLPEETREYVPRVLAAAIICNNAQKYGLGN